VTVPPRTTPTTTSSESSSNGTPTWVWVLIGILAVALVAVIVVLATRGKSGGAIPPEERRRRLDGAVAGWAAQGWAIESQTEDSAVLRSGPQTMLISVDAAGHVSSRPLPASGAPPSY
jgi:hypothetical protein